MCVADWRVFAAVYRWACDWVESGMQEEEKSILDFFLEEVGFEPVTFDEGYRLTTISAILPVMVEGLD